MSNAPIASGYPASWTKEEIEESEHWCRLFNSSIKSETPVPDKEARRRQVAVLKTQRAYHKKEADRLLDAIITLELMSIRLEQKEKTIN